MPRLYFTMAKERYEKGLHQLTDGALGKMASGEFEYIHQAARAYSDEYGTIRDTGISLYEWAMAFFEGDEDELSDYLQAVYDDNEELIALLLGCI